METEKPTTNEITARINQAKQKRPRGGHAPTARNAIRHGLRGTNLPKGCSYIKQACSRFRRSLEDCVLAHAPAFVRSRGAADADLRAGRTRSAEDVFADLEND